MLNRREIAVLALAYAENHAKRQPSTVSALRTSVSCSEEISPWGVTRALKSLLRQGLVELGKDGDGRSLVVITPAGRTWMDNHVDFWRQGNRWHYRVVAGTKPYSGPRGRGFWSWFFNRYFELKYNR